MALEQASNFVFKEILASYIIDQISPESKIMIYKQLIGNIKINDDHLYLLYNLIIELQQDNINPHYKDLDIIKRLQSIKLKYEKSNVIPSVIDIETNIKTNNRVSIYKQAIQAASIKQDTHDIKKDITESIKKSIKEEAIKTEDNQEGIKEECIKTESIQEEAKLNPAESKNKVIKRSYATITRENIKNAENSTRSTSPLKENTQTVNENSKPKNDLNKINFSDKEEFTNVVNKFRDDIVSICKEAIQKHNSFDTIDITPQIMDAAKHVHELYPGTFNSTYIAFSQLLYGPLCKIKEGEQPNYFKRNLELYTKRNMNLAFIQAQEIMFPLGYKLLDISDPEHKKRTNKDSIEISNVHKIILIENKIIHPSERLNLWHNLNKISFKPQYTEKPIKVRKGRNQEESSEIQTPEEMFNSAINDSEDDTEQNESDVINLSTVSANSIKSTENFVDSKNTFDPLSDDQN